MSLPVFIAICASVLFLVAMVGGLFPVFIYRTYAKQLKGQHAVEQEMKEQRLNAGLSYANVFSGGIFFGGGLLSLLPEAASSMLICQRASDVPVLTHFPVAYVICGVGLFSILFIDEFAHGAAEAGDGHSSESAPRTELSHSSSTCVQLCHISDHDHYQHVDEEPVVPPIRVDDSELGMRTTSSSSHSRSLPEQQPLGVPSQKRYRKRQRKASDVNNSSASVVLLSDAVQDQEANEEEGADNSMIDPSVCYHHDLSSQSSFVSTAIIVFALSFHSFFEGIALGTQSTMSSAVLIFITILAHTPLAGLALGISLVKSGTTLSRVMTLLLVFAVTCPVGVFLGLLLSARLAGTTLLLVTAIFQSFSTGTLLYVALHEILSKELAATHSSRARIAKVSLCLAGFTIIALLQLAHE